MNLIVNSTVCLKKKGTQVLIEYYDGLIKCRWYSDGCNEKNNH